MWREWQIVKRFSHVFLEINVQFRQQITPPIVIYRQESPFVTGIIILFRNHSKSGSDYPDGTDCCESNMWFWSYSRRSPLLLHKSRCLSADELALRHSVEENLFLCSWKRYVLHLLKNSIDINTKTVSVLLTTVNSSYLSMNASVPRVNAFNFLEICIFEIFNKCWLLP